MARLKYLITARQNTEPQYISSLSVHSQSVHWNVLDAHTEPNDRPFDRTTVSGRFGGHNAQAHLHMPVHNEQKVHGAHNRGEPALSHGEMVHRTRALFDAAHHYRPTLHSVHDGLCSSVMNTYQLSLIYFLFLYKYNLQMNDIKNTQ